MGYLLDANVFMTGKNLYYGFDFCPAFWEWLQQNNASGKVFSIEKVGDELEAGNDSLAGWAEKYRTDFFLKPDPAILPSLGKVSAWATSQKYAPAAVSTFLQSADYYLIAYALTHGHTVVTLEKPAPGSVTKIKIPDVCIGLRVKFMNTFEMLRHERARFVLGPEK